MCPDRTARTPGAVSIACARQAIEDFNPDEQGHGGGISGGRSPEQYEHRAQYRMREWFDRSDVDAVLEVNNSAIALALNNLCTQKDKEVHLNSGAVTADLTGKVVLAEHGALDLRQLDAVARSVHDADQSGVQDLVLCRARLCIRRLADPGFIGRRGGNGRQGAWRWQSIHSRG